MIIIFIDTIAIRNSFFAIMINISIYFHPLQAKLSELQTKRWTSWLSKSLKPLLCQIQTLSLSKPSYCQDVPKNKHYHSWHYTRMLDLLQIWTFQWKEVRNLKFQLSHDLGQKCDFGPKICDKYEFRPDDILPPSCDTYKPYLEILSVLLFFFWIISTAGALVAITV